MQQTVRITHLEMRSPVELRPASAVNAVFELKRAEYPSPEFSRFLYTAVGHRWHWYERLGWSYERWSQYLAKPTVETWYALVAGTPAGYVELEKQEGDEVEIMYFGLLAPFIGRGLGGVMLTAAIRRAWDMGASLVRVHTCSNDHPKALDNYRSRGFKVVRVEERIENIPVGPLEPWPGALDVESGSL